MIGARRGAPAMGRNEKRLARMALFAGLAALAAGAAAPAVSAQVSRPRPVRPNIDRRPPADTSKAGDSARADSARSRELIKWTAPDSITARLMERAGYAVTRYQGVRVRFDSKNRTLYLEGDPAGIGRGATLLVGDTITYNDSTKLVVARGDTLVLRDPTQGAADVVAQGQLRYNVEARRGSVTNISTSVETGQTWHVRGAEAAFVRDTTRGLQTSFYARNGSITSCDDSIPDYHFQSKEIKLVTKNILVARPAVLYIGDVPVFWLPFIFQDMRSGRRSGMLTPRFGVTELFRNSPSYRRHVDNIGYYFAFNDYTDGQLSLDWRSGAGATSGDPGWVRVNGEWRYRWLDRFLTGRLAVSRLGQRDGNNNTAISWAHQQDFSQTSHLTTNINYVTNTAIQRQNSFDPRQVLATIQSQVNYQQQFGKASFSIGGSRRQYPGREEVTQDFPNFSISTPTVALAPWLEWTPSLNVTNSEQFKVDRTGQFAYDYRTSNGVLDSVRATSDARITSLGLTTPLKIFGFTLQSSFRVRDQENNAPVTIAVVNQDDPTRPTNRIFGRTYSTEIDFETSFGLPTLMPGTLKLSPSIGISNVDPAGYWVRTEQSGGRFVHQSKRLRYSLQAAPTIFGLLPGIGGISRFRHSLSPVMSYGYAPAATVSREFLAALNRNPRDYVGSLAANQVTLQLSQTLEAKLRSRDTSSVAEERKVKLLSLNFSPLTYDFERKRATGRSGFTTDHFGYDVGSELLPGFRLGVQYSLFEGSVLSDTAVFKPFRTGIDASFSLNGQSGIFAALTRMFGRAVPQPSPQVERLDRSADDALSQRIASTPVAGSQSRNQQYGMPGTQAWQASFTFGSSRQRPPTGSGEIIDEDPTTRCAVLVSNPFAYEQCILQQQTNPTGAVPIGRLTAGGPFVRIPSREFIHSQMSFNITPKWGASWGTTYDFQERQFASHAVTLQRELHDWRTIFAFTRSPNGNFAFNFFIALNAQPDIKFNYDRQTYRQTGQ
ncbi:MAG: LPS-assembly protein LptD [Gemmatimonadaceae bacterium]|nr:LPS-assembly protein LptD [Gemmatimonadaceae bacterium]